MRAKKAVATSRSAPSAAEATETMRCAAPARGTCPVRLAWLVSPPLGVCERCTPSAHTSRPSDAVPPRRAQEIEAERDLTPKRIRRSGSVGDAEWLEVKTVVTAEEADHWQRPLEDEGLTSSRRILAVGGGGWGRGDAFNTAVEERMVEHYERGRDALGLKDGNLTRAALLLDARALMVAFSRRATDGASAKIREDAAAKELGVKVILRY